MNYCPRGMRVWDAWYMPVGDQVHMYHLQRARREAQVPPQLQDNLGHALTTDLIAWEEKPALFGPDPGNPRDDRQPWTGCALWHEGRGYLFYTMRGSASKCREQAIGLATSTDAENWVRYPENPLFVPDPRYYATPRQPVPGILDCRDLQVIPDPRGGWLGYYATRQPGEELPQTSVIACVHSMDLIHWDHLPPAFAPAKYACIEVPDVFPLGGRWYMTCLTGNWYGNRGIFNDPNLVNGTIYAVADDPRGPFTELDDNALVAAKTTGPISAKSVMLGAERYLLYTDRERHDRTDQGMMTTGTISTPKLLRTNGDRLVAAYSPRIEKRVLAELIGTDVPPQPRTGEPWGQLWPMSSGKWELDDGRVVARCRTGWSVLPLTHKSESFIFEARITLHDAVAAGFIVRLCARDSGAVVALDADQQVVFFAAAPAFDFTEQRRTLIRRGQTMHLRVVNRLEHVEIYVDDELKLAFSRYQGIGGEVGLFVDRGRATYQNLRLRTLNVAPPQ